MAFKIETGDGNSNIYTNATGTIDTGKGNQTILADADKMKITTKDGNSKIAFFGDNSSVTSGNGDNDIVFSGDNVTGKLGDGDNSVRTLDIAIQEGDYTKYKDRIKTNDTTTESKKLVSSTTTGEIPSGSTVSQLSSAEQNVAKGVNLGEKLANGKPQYIVAKATDGKYHLYKANSDGSSYKCVVGTAQGSNYLYINGTTTENGKYSVNNSYEVTTTKISTLIGAYNPNFILGEGNSKAYMTVKDANGSVVTGDGNQDIMIRTGKEVSSTSTSTTTSKETLTEAVKYTIASSNSKTGSPLIIDFNRNGKVSAVAGKGVDINNDTKADGAATDGDKMLAMSNFNGNNKIDGSEVFGDKTVNPFTGRAINAKNGFEALKAVALSAERYTGIKCLDGTDVDLQKLKTALLTVGVNLGFISDDNVTELEELTKVKSINVSDYKEQQENGDVQHNQLGTATFEDGSKNKVDDVWFKL